MADEKSRALTIKQAAFASAYVELGNASEAYRRSYNVDPNAKDEWMRIEGYKLLEHPKVALRIAELQNELAEMQRFGRYQAMEELNEARELALTEKQAAAAIKATEVKIKMLGLEAPAKLELTGKDGGPVRTQEVARDRIARRLAGLSAAGNPSGDTGEPE